MQIKSSADLRNSYKEISDLAKASGEPIYITINGAGDGVFMSMEAFEQMEETLLMRSRVLAAEHARQAGAKTYSQEEVDEKLKSIMKNIHEACVQYGTEADGYVNYVKGANVAGFMKVAKAMMAQGIV